MLILGHRGTGVTMFNSQAQEEVRREKGSKFPENTLKAFKTALVGGADGIELDVIRTSDDKMAIMHDNALNLHVAGACREEQALGYVEHHTMTQLQSLNVGDGYGVPSLKSCLNLSEDYNAAVVNIELKGYGTARLAYQEAVDSNFPNHRIIFSSFDHQQLKQLRNDWGYERTKIGLLFEERALPVSRIFPDRKNSSEKYIHFSPQYVDSVMTSIKPTSLHPILQDCSDELLNYAAHHKLDVFVWTKNEKAPLDDPAVLTFALKHKKNPHIHLITDFPVEIKHALIHS